MRPAGIRPEAEAIVGTSAGAVVGALTASGMAPAYMAAYVAGHEVDEIAKAAARAEQGRDRVDEALAMARSAEADGSRPDGSGYRLASALPPIGPGSWRLALRTLVQPKRHSPAAMLCGWLPRGFVAHRSDQRSSSRRSCRATGPTMTASGRRGRLRERQAGRVRPLGCACGEGGARRSRRACAIPAFYHPVSVARPPLRRRRDLLSLEPRPAVRRGARPRRLPEPDVLARPDLRRLARGPRRRAAPDVRRAPARTRGAQAARRRHQSPDAPAGRRRREGHGLQHDVRPPALHGDVDRDEEHRPGAAPAAAARQLGPAWAVALAPGAAHAGRLPRSASAARPDRSPGSALSLPSHSRGSESTATRAVSKTVEAGF